MALLSQCCSGFAVFVWPLPTVDVNKMFTKSFPEHVSIILHQIRKHELVTSVEDYNVLMLISCKICKFVDCHVNGGI